MRIISKMKLGEYVLPYNLWSYAIEYLRKTIDRVKPILLHINGILLRLEDLPNADELKKLIKNNTIVVSVVTSLRRHNFTVLDIFDVNTEETRDSYSKEKQIPVIKFQYNVEEVQF